MTENRYLLIFCMFSIIHQLFGDVCNASECENRSTANFPWIVGTGYHTGFLINHNSSMRILNEQIPYSVELFIAKPTDGSKPWHSFYGNPLYGVSYMMLDPGSPSYLGKAHGIYPFLQFPLTRAERMVNLNLRIGTGIAYVEKIFDRSDNYKNAAISNHWNVLVNFRTEIGLRLAAPLHLSGGLAFSHISNGALKKPNLGLNHVTAFAGATYAFGKKTAVETAEQTSHDMDGKWHYTVYLSGGVKTYSIFEDVKYAVSGLSLEASRSHLAFTQFYGRLDVLYDRSDYPRVVENEENARRIQTVKPAFAAGYAFLFGQLSAHVQMGGYLYAKVHEYGWIYQRLALNYAISSRLNVRYGLKTHWGNADYLEFALGYRIR